MEKIALFPGSFDPITNGHLDIVQKGLGIFEKIIIGIGRNSSKKSLFSLEDRMHWINQVFKDNDRVEVRSYEGLTVKFCKEIKATHILRGLVQV
ncbi:MAG: adenylyltransferase/cytidyltransferase family protein [Bacteroidia bacterium]